MVEPSIQSSHTLAGSGRVVTGAAALITAILGWWLLAPSRGFAADTATGPKGFDPEVARKFAGVKEWQGFWEVTETRSISKSNAMGYMENVYEGSGYGRFVLQRTLDEGWDPGRGDFRWRGNGEANGMRNETMASWSKSGPRMVGEDWRQFDGGQAQMQNVEFTIWMARQYASVAAGTNLDGALKKKREGHAVVSLSSADGQHHYEEKTIDEAMPGSILSFFVPNNATTAPRQWGVVQSGPGVLVFEHEESTHDATSGDGLRRSRVVLSPIYDDVEVDVTIEGYANERPAGSAKGRRVSYAKWLPEGSIEDPKKPGNNLTARAVLKSKKGGTKDLPVARSFRFELLETSREPGVCLNWPLDAKDEDFDLRLASAPAGPGTLSDNDQRLEVEGSRKDGQGLPYADAMVECFDFGARSELRVTCLLEDGRELIGLVVNAEGRRDLILLPQREPGDWIANAWRREHDVVGLAGNDDSEETPGNTHHGDGYTLYEEYRGFAVRGRHVEGDPKKKDLCILNLIESDAWVGIHMFEAATGLRAIFRLLPSEMSADERVMNGNHRAAPHRGDQHGVCLVTGKAGDIANGGALTVFSTPYLHGRPGITKEIELPARNDPTSDFNKPWNLPPEDEAVAFDRAVAHELAHSVGAIHHGLGDVWITVRYFPADDPRNKLGRPALFVGDNGERGWIQLLHETTKEDYLLHEGPVLEAALQKSLGGSSGYAALPARQREEIANLLKTFQWYAGVEKGQCSGDEQCLMRYYFAQVYQRKGTANTFYLVDPGSDDVGNILCASFAGTRTNGKDHDPQPRYFGANADFGCGDCRAEICPNDRIPPLPRRDGL